MPNYLQVLESPLTRDRIALIPQDKKAIALSILKLRKNPSDTRSKSVIRERINVTGDRVEKRELERILSFAECPVYSDTQKGHLEMAQNIGLHWANKIIAKHGEAVIDSFANDFDWDVRNKSTHEDLKSEFQDRLSNYFDNVSPDMTETEKAIAKKLSGLDNLIGPIKYEDWTDTTPADTRFQESVTERFFDYADENIGLITKEIQEKQSARRKEIIETSTTQLNKLSENTSSKVMEDFLTGKNKDGKTILEELAEGYDYKDLTDEIIKDTLLDHLIERTIAMTGEKSLSRKLDTIAERFDEHSQEVGFEDTESYFTKKAEGQISKLIASNMEGIRQKIKETIVVTNPALKGTGLV